MDRKVLAICDQETQYAVKLMKAFSEKQSFGFQVRVFSNVDELEQFLSQQSIEILLITGRDMSERVGCLNITKIILLTDGEIFEEFSAYESVCKYQSAERILKSILGFYAESAQPVSGMYSSKNDFRIHGVYSPVGRCGKSALAKALAGKLGRSKKTLLLDLQSFAAREEQLGEAEQWDLADLIYFLRQGKRTFLYKLGSIVRNRGTYDEILPMKIPADLKSVTLAEWTELLDKLATDSEYDEVVVKFGNDICGLFQLLSRCTRVYLPVISDIESKRKVQNFEWIIENENFENLIHCIQKIYLSSDAGCEAIEAFMKEWVERSVTC